MKYAECLPENRPIPITCRLVKEFGFDYEVIIDESYLGTTTIYVIVSRKLGGFLKKDRIICCANVNLTHLRMAIYGDDHKEQMVNMAQQLEERLSMVPSRFIGPGELDVEFVSHDTLTIKV